MASWGLLDEKSESELHKTRLLNVEEKPFRRIAKRVGSVSSIVRKLAEPLESAQHGATPSAKEIELVKEDFTLDFAAFDSSIARLQFLLNANARERERYQEDQQRIMAECQAVRNNNAQLREQLDGARATLARRKKFDELAEKITSNRLLRPREDQIVNLAKLEEECKELERESQTYSETWNERRSQFNRIMDEGMLLRRQIRDEKEEVDRREGMNEGGDDEDEADKGGRTPRHEPSRPSTPHPDGDVQIRVNGEDETLQQQSIEGTTPQGETPAPDGLRSSADRDQSQLQADDASGSRAATPKPPTEKRTGESGEDVEMEEHAQSGREMDDVGTIPQVTLGSPAEGEDKMEVDD